PLLFIVQHALALVLLLVIAAAAGTAVAGRETPLALRSTLGLAVAGQVFVVLATVGALRPWTIGALAAVAVAIYIWRDLVPQLGRRARRPATAGEGARAPSVLAMVAAALFVLALYPPIAFDETLYHLPFVRAVAGSGALRFLPDLRFPVFPQLHELL